MNQQNPRRVAVWIDHETAMLITLTGKRVGPKKELYSDAGPHPHTKSQLPHHVEAHYHEALKHFYQEVARQLGTADEILIVGPGQAKHELRQHIKHCKGVRGKVKKLCPADKLTMKELIAQARDVFGLKKEKVA